MKLRHRSRILSVLAVGLTLALVADVADARPGRGGSFGSRGARTFDAPPATTTAPRSAAPIERSAQPQAAQPSGPQRLGQAAQQRPGFFGRGGFMPGLMTGLLGAGLIGMLMGNGFLGGLAGLAGFLGLLLQVGLIAGLVWFALRLFRRRQEPALAGAGAPVNRDLGGAAGAGLAERFGLGGSRPAGTLYDRGRTASAVPRDDVGIGQEDLDAFESALSEVHAAYGREDRAALGARVTPEMMSYFAEELDRNEQEGMVNRVSGVRLLQGDLAESWREGGVDYATLAMRYALTDVTEERETGRIVDGSSEPTEATELWTFVRNRATGSWKLSAIQQA